MTCAVGFTLIRLEGISKYEQGNRLLYGNLQRSDYGKPTFSLGVPEKEMQIKAKGHQDPVVLLHT